MEHHHSHFPSSNKMNITIHRGAEQIGGCITEIRTSKAKIIIDLGSNLPRYKQTDFTLQEISQIIAGADAILYTHYHGDHIGFFSAVPPTIPQYIGSCAQDVIRCLYTTLNKKGDYNTFLAAIERMQNYEANKPMHFGDLSITPYYCSHSAFDAYMFKIEWNGKVILHTGDFRKHGYMGSKLIPMLKKYVGQIDVLITEGTMLGRKSEITQTELDIQIKCKAILKKNKYVYALCSSTDIDRLASFHAACKATRRHFYIDQYQYNILQAITNHTTSPLYNFSKVNGTNGTTFVFKDSNVLEQEKVVQHMTHRGFLMPIRCNCEAWVKTMMDLYKDEEPILLYSMWDGYWNGTDEQIIPGALTIRNFFKPENIIAMHTSGHADATTLSEVCSTLAPKLAIIPIHKDKNTDFCSLAISEELKSRVITSDKIIDDISITIR